MGHNHTIPWRIPTALQQSCDADAVAHKAKNTYCLILQRRDLLTPELGEKVSKQFLKVGVIP